MPTYAPDAQAVEEFVKTLVAENLDELAYGHTIKVVIPDHILSDQLPNILRMHHRLAMMRSNSLYWLQYKPMATDNYIPVTMQPVVKRYKQLRAKVRKVADQFVYNNIEAMRHGNYVAIYSNDFDNPTESKWFLDDLRTGGLVITDPDDDGWIRTHGNATLPYSQWIGNTERDV